MSRPVGGILKATIELNTFLPFPVLVVVRCCHPPPGPRRGSTVRQDRSQSRSSPPQPAQLTTPATGDRSEDDGEGHVRVLVGQSRLVELHDLLHGD